MRICACFTAFTRGQNRQNVTELPSKTAQFNAETKSELNVKPVETNGLKSVCKNVAAPGNQNFMSKAKVMNHESPVREEAAEAAYEGEDEHEENLIKGSTSDLDFPVQETSEHQTELSLSNKMDSFFSLNTRAHDHDQQKTVKADLKTSDMIRSGHVSDPGIGKAETWASPKLKRTCSNLEASNVLRRIAEQLPPSKSQSFEEPQELAANMRKDITPSSPLSVITNCSADRVMLKKHSSSQILPSRSKRLWWKLYLWSHRNLHKSWTIRRRQPQASATSKQQGGYCSDTLEPNQTMELSHIGSPGSFTGEPKNAIYTNKTHDNGSWDSFQNGISGFWPQNQWVAFPGESSSYSRVDEWVKDLETLPPSLPSFGDDDSNDERAIPPYPDTGKSPAKYADIMNRHQDITLSEFLHAHGAIQSLNSSSTVAHISGTGLKLIPSMARFSSLRSVNLSNNFIVHITPGSLPKGLHTLNLSRNKITTIEGLRDLTHLRVLDLSYNRITRIGQGLSNCTLIKELYLAGNRISDVEGLHRLFKLTVLDLSFNKITTKKALGQLVANYSSLLALNLLGNPIQSNISDDQLRKAVCGLLPKLIYLNKQPTKPQRAREVIMDSVAKAALGDSKNSRRKAVKRINQGMSYPSSGHKSNRTVGQKGRHRSRSHANRHSLPQTASRSAVENQAYVL